MNNKLNKKELDKLSKEEFYNYRINYLRQNDNDDILQYIKELEVYMNVRFKQDVYDRYNRWCNQDKENKKNNVNDELLSFNVELLNKENGFDHMYNLTLIDNLKKVGEFKYIKEIDINIPEMYKNLFKL